MILLVHKDMSQIKDFIMWADVEFAIQLELLETQRFQTQDCTIIDLLGLDQLKDIDSSEPLYVICHGGKNSNETYLDGYKHDWTSLGDLIGKHLSVKANKIVLFACYAAYGTVNYRPIDLFAKGLSTFRKGVKITGYKGATVTNTIGTVTAREQPGGSSHDPFLVANDSTMKRAGEVDTELRNNYTPQLQFDSFLQSEPKASPRKKAITAANKAEQFYAAFSKQFMEESLYYAVGSNLGLPVVVTS
ncbi:hypothetical protein [Methylomonas sp. AM2-LC]|uniref:hypothetical protein n=1 Tax=Methylomonas sp. AM2-LC TaxID=3153301 RepID=UPI003266DC2C